jgi:hypothetical protein
MARSSQLKTSVATARKAIKGSNKNTKIAKLPTLPSDLEYYRQSDGGIGIREKLSTFKKPKGYR